MVKRILAGIAAIIVLLALIYTGASWFIGVRAKMLIQDQVAAYNRQLDYNLPVGVQVMLSVDAYQRHVFTSDARYTLTIAAGARTRRFAMSGHLVHGPFPYTELGRGNVRPLLAASYLRLLPSRDAQPLFAARVDRNKPPVTARTVLTFRGGGRSVWRFQPLAAKQGATSFSGGTATVSMTNNYRDATLNAEFGGVKVDARDLFLHFQGIGIRGETTVADSGVATSRLAATVGLITSRSRGGLKQTARDARLVLDGTLAQGLVAGKLQYSVGHMQSGRADLGDFALAAHAANIDMQVIRALLKMAAGRAAGGAGQSQQLGVQAVIDRLLAPQPVIAIDRLRWQAPAGTSSMMLKLHLTRPPGAMSQPLMLLLADAVQRGELKLSVSKSMAAQVFRQSLADTGMDAGQHDGRARAIISQRIAMLERTGLFVVKDDVVQTAISYRDRAFVVNGNSMSLGEFIGHLFALAMAFR